MHRLVTKAPQRVNIDLLAALCDALDCAPSDLLEPVVEADERAAAASGKGVVGSVTYARCGPRSAGLPAQSERRATSRSHDLCPLWRN